MITAEEFLEQQDCIRNVEDFFNDVQPIDLIEFAKLHVAAALQAAVEDAPCGSSTDTVSCEDMKDAILSAYPLTNIK